MNKSRIGGTIAVVLGMVAATSGPAAAAVISIEDSASTGNITISACDFAYGAFVNGSLMGSCGGSYGGVVTVPAVNGMVQFSGGYVDPIGTGIIDRTIYFVEAAMPGTISDILKYSYVAGGPANSTNVAIEFTSASSGSLGLLPSGIDPGDVFMKNGMSYDFGLTSLSAQALSYEAVSFVTAAAVPEPTSMALVGLALSGVFLTRRRRT